MSVRIDTTSVIVAKLNLEKGGKVHKFFASECKNRMEKYVPKRRGDLRGDAYVEGTSIVYDKDYAKYQFRGMREDGSHVISNWTTPGTGPHWDKKMWSAEGHLVEQAVKDCIARGGK